MTRPTTLARTLALLAPLTVLAACEKRSEDPQGPAPQVQPVPTTTAPTVAPNALPVQPGQNVPLPPQPGQTTPVAPQPGQPVAAPTAVPAGVDPNIIALQGRIEQLERRVGTLEGNVLYLNQQDEQLRAQLTQTQTELRQTQAQVAGMQSQARTARRRINEMQVQPQGGQ